MTSFSLKGFARAADEMAVLQDRLPAAQIGPLAEASKKVLLGASRSSGGVHADEKNFSIDMYLPRRTQSISKAPSFTRRIWWSSNLMRSSSRVGG